MKVDNVEWLTDSELYPFVAQKGENIMAHLRRNKGGNFLAHLRHED